MLEEWAPVAPSLIPFHIKEEAVFHAYMREGLDVPIPALPSNNKQPSLLLHDLKDVSRKESPAYKYIDETQIRGPHGLYGTSGAGKTRTAFEYLAHNYGFYFVVDKNHNPGSLDVALLLQRCDANLVQINTGIDTGTSECNLVDVQALLKTLVCVRKAVFKGVNNKLKDLGYDGLTCWEWLLLQLYPDTFLGRDIFRDLCKTFFNRKDCNYEVGEGEQQMSCFVDEAQVLLTKLEGFFLSKTGGIPRSAYSAFVKGLYPLAVEGIIHFPCFSGTGLSMDAFEPETRSVMAKPADYRCVFTELQTMTTANVIAYIKKFLDLVTVNTDLVEHVASWLRGRPRWTATYLETFLVRVAKDKFAMPRGNFAEAELPMITSLNRYIEVHTEFDKASQESRRHSWSLGKMSAYSAIENLFTTKGHEWSEAQMEFRKAILNFTLTGKPYLVTKEAATLIEYGVASVDTSNNKAGGGHISGKIDEPLIVKAGINFFGIEKLVANKLASADSESEKAIVLSNLCFPPSKRDSQP
jgi:hypothetical protein